MASATKKIRDPDPDELLRSVSNFFRSLAGKPQVMAPVRAKTPGHEVTNPEILALLESPFVTDTLEAIFPTLQYRVAEKNLGLGATGSVEHAAPHRINIHPGLIEILSLLGIEEGRARPRDVLAHEMLHSDDLTNPKYRLPIPEAWGTEQRARTFESVLRMMTGADRAAERRDLEQYDVKIDDIGINNLIAEIQKRIENHPRAKKRGQTQ